MYSDWMYTAILAIITTIIIILTKIIFNMIIEEV